MMLKRFSFGLRVFSLGWAEVRADKKLRRLMIIPMLIDVILFVLALSFSLPLIPKLLESALAFIFASPEGWFYWILYYPLALIFGVVFVVGVGAVTYFAASVIASPFNAIMAEHVLAKSGLVPDKSFRLSRFLTTAVKMFFVSLIRSLLVLCFGIFLFLLSFFPGVNLLTSYITFILVAFDASDFALETMEYSVRQRFGFLRENFAEYAGMGGSIGLAMLVPGLMILLMPLGVVGATLVVTTRVEKKLGATQ